MVELQAAEGGVARGSVGSWFSTGARNVASAAPAQPVACARHMIRPVAP
jgi:hypothetical protein